MRRYALFLFTWPLQFAPAIFCVFPSYGSSIPSALRRTYTLLGVHVLCAPQSGEQVGKPQAHVSCYDEHVGTEAVCLSRDVKGFPALDNPTCLYYIALPNLFTALHGNYASVIYFLGSASYLQGLGLLSYVTGH